MKGGRTTDPQSREPIPMSTIYDPPISAGPGQPSEPPPWFGPGDPVGPGGPPGYGGGEGPGKPTRRFPAGS